jgi:hypothetical protein
MSNKSEATWHPKNGPMTEHADPGAEEIARLVAEGHAEVLDNTTVSKPGTARERDSVPRYQHDDLLGIARFAQSAFTSAQRERDEARAERDALAHIIREALMAISTWNINGATLSDLSRILDPAPAVSPARHDAEVMCPHWAPGSITLRPACTSCAAAIRTEANDHSN